MAIVNHFLRIGSVLFLTLSLLSCATTIKNEADHWAWLPTFKHENRCDTHFELGEMVCPEQAICVEGDCINGLGTKQAPDGSLSYRGYWQDGRTVAGNYQVTYQQQAFDTAYDSDGFIRDGFLLVEDAMDDPDYFFAEFKRYIHPFTKKESPLPDSGEYVFANGARLKGEFIAIPTIGHSRDELDGKNDGYVHLYDVYHLFFIGMVTVGQNSETGIYVQRDYTPGSPLEMMPSDRPTIEKIQREYLTEVTEYERYKERKEQQRKELERISKAKSDAPWGKIFALAAGVVLANSADIPVDVKADFLTAYSKDVLNGSTSNMKDLQSRYANDKSVDEIFREGDKKIHEIVNQKMAAQKRTQQQTLAQQTSHSAQSGGSTPNNKRNDIDDSVASPIAARSAEVSSNTSTPTPTCVAQAESTGPMPNVPSQYCRLVFADYTGNTAIGWEDYTNEFNAESGSLENAKKNILYPLLEKAKMQCQSRGYDRVHHPDSFAYNQLDYQVTSCKENIRAGATFHLCIGRGSFICARSN